jgi:AraC-like DNA-binding protein
MSLRQPHWDSLHLELLHIYDDAVLPWGRKVKDIPPANYYRAWLLRSGRGRAKIGSRWHTLTPGEWLVPSPSLSAQEFSDDALLFSLHFRARWPDGGMLFDVGAGVKLPASRHPQLEAAARALREGCRRSSSPRYGDPVGPENLTLDQHLHVGELFRRWLRVFCTGLAAEGLVPTAPAAMDERVRDGLRWLDQFPLRSKFRERLLAERLGLSVIHLNRLFALEIKRSPAAYLEQRRWERASYLLLNSSRSAKEVAYELGFCSPSYFTTWVKNHAGGKTPLQFRNRALPK